MGLKILLTFISTLLVLSSPVVYIRSILKGISKPHRTTRFTVLLITLLSTASLFAEGDRVAVWLAAASAIQAVFIFALSIKRGMGGWAKLDIVCLVIALAGIILWQATSKPLLGLYASILADFVGYIPALVKTYKLPHTEDWRFYAMDSLAGLLSALALTEFRFSTISYPVYILLINLFMVWLIKSPKRHPAT